MTLSQCVFIGAEEFSRENSVDMIVAVSHYVIRLIISDEINRLAKQGFNRSVINTKVDRPIPQTLIHYQARSLLCLI